VLGRGIDDDIHGFVVEDAAEISRGLGTTPLARSTILAAGGRRLRLASQIDNATNALALDTLRRLLYQYRQ
jgi:hypothetical protein